MSTKQRFLTYEMLNRGKKTDYLPILAKTCTRKSSKGAACRALTKHGPLLDRIDMQIQVGALPHEDLLRQADGEPSSAVHARVERAFALQLNRQGKGNHALSTGEIDAHCKPDAAAEQLLRAAMIRLNWSARAYHRVLKVTRTIADLGGQTDIGSAHIAEAIQYRRALREH